MKTNKVRRFETRLSERERNKAQIIANEYAGGDLSRWVRYAIFEAPRKYLVKKKTGQ